MHNYKILALDETGKASFKHLSKTFILSGLILAEDKKDEFNNSIRKLKKNYFGKENIVFHCRDILRKKGPFSILQKSTAKEIKFWEDYINILEAEYLSMAFVITDKKKARKIGWNDIAILKRSYSKILEEFTAKHLKKGKGRIIAESDQYQDRYC